MMASRRIVSFLVVLAGLLWSQTAFASHFRYGTIHWRVPNPGSAPLTVEFTVDQAWRTTLLDCVNMDFGDGSPTGNPCSTVTTVGTGTDVNGNAYTVREYVVSHTYATAGQFLAFFQGSARVAGLVNGSNAAFRVETQVSLASGNTGGPVSAAPPIISLQLGATRTFDFPVSDPDGDPTTCRLATDTEVGFTGSVPHVPLGGAAPSLAMTGGSCRLTWDLTLALTGQQYVVHYVIESTHGGQTSSTAVDLMVQIVNTAPPTCSGGGNFTVPEGTAFSTMVTGTDSGGSVLALTALGAPLTSTFAPNGSHATPFTTTFAWTPGILDYGTTRNVVVNFTNTLFQTGTCTITIQVPLCNGAGAACTNGLGECAAGGATICVGPGLVGCDAVPGVPSPELCDNLDNNCNGVADELDPEGGVACTSAFPGVCAPGLTDCQAGGNLVCVPTVTPGTLPENCTDNLDTDCDGDNDNGCIDTDGDGLFDDVEDLIGTDPNDADSDDDGVPDGAELDFDLDTDGDGLINALDPDSDDDGLFDGTELGLDCANPATDVSKGHCRADADPSTTTNPLLADTDGGGVMDGSEDANLNGALDAGETDPTLTHGGDDLTVTDTDGDGLSDTVELFLHSDPNDADSDDDGVLDGQEHNWSDDTDGDGLVNVLDTDSDNDGLFDGTEVGNDCSNIATNTALGHCIADADPSTHTSSVNPDTDHGGVRDGSEDANLNGAVDAGETDPTSGHGADDADVVDTDGDGLSDLEEATLGTDPNDADSDNDGVPDGLEPNVSDDVDGDGFIDALDPDSDGDGIFDGTELGFDCSNPDTDTTLNLCVADADGGTTKTSAINPDTDFGGVLDGVEDTSHNGRVDAGERDPLDPLDDQPCDTDTDCGGAMSGKVCDPTHTCIDGCRGTNGNGCPDGSHCTSTDDTIGTCEPNGEGGAGGGGGSGNGSTSSTSSTSTTNGSSSGNSMSTGSGTGSSSGGAGAGGSDSGYSASGHGIFGCSASRSADGGGFWGLALAVGVWMRARRRRRS